MADHGPSSAAGLPTRPLVRILRGADLTARQEGDAVLLEARREAQQLSTSARRAYASEYAQGYKDGKRQGDADAAQLVAQTLVQVDRYLAGIEQDVSDLVLTVTRRILGHFDVTELVAQAADQAVADLRQARFLKIRVHPANAGAVRHRIEASLHPSRLGCTVEVEADEDLAPDACTLSTDFAVIDAGLEAQLGALAAALTANKGETE